MEFFIKEYCTNLIWSKKSLRHVNIIYYLNISGSEVSVSCHKRFKIVSNYWNKCKRRFKAMHGTTIGNLPSYLDEFMWRDTSRLLRQHPKTHSRILSSVATSLHFQSPACLYVIAAVHNIRDKSPVMSKTFAWFLSVYWWIQDTRASSIVCFTILVLPVLLDEEFWSFQYCVFYNTSITSIVGWRILEFPVLCALQY